MKNSLLVKIILIKFSIIFSSLQALAEGGFYVTGPRSRSGGELLVRRTQNNGGELLVRRTQNSDGDIMAAKKLPQQNAKPVETDLTIHVDSRGLINVIIAAESEKPTYLFRGTREQANKFFSSENAYQSPELVQKYNRIQIGVLDKYYEATKAALLAGGILDKALDNPKQVLVYSTTHGTANDVVSYDRDLVRFHYIIKPVFYSVKDQSDSKNIAELFRAKITASGKAEVKSGELSDSLKGALQASEQKKDWVPVQPKVEPRSSNFNYYQQMPKMDIQMPRMGGF